MTNDNKCPYTFLKWSKHPQLRILYKQNYKIFSNIFSFYRYVVFLNGEQVFQTDDKNVLKIKLDLMGLKLNGDSYSSFPANKVFYLKEM